MKGWFDWLLRVVLCHEYFDKQQQQQHISADKNTVTIVKLNILIMLTNSLANIINIGTAWQTDWFYVFQCTFEGYLYAMQHYMILHHGLILSYIEYCVSKLNNQLQHGTVKRPFAKVYFQLARVLQDVNVVYGPAIVSMLLGILLINAAFVYEIIIDINFLEYDAIVIEFSFLFVIPTLSCFNTYLYFLICHRTYETMKETQRIILDYVTRRENQEVCLDN
ncbi:hypothetical protein FF38_05228 [Lucilia cuprina]|uniref:Gustatory receptor n=1 Tax=Lucilia cuprina TaxID=7375 RepID=A0A0L0CBY1_LUCCU|nr:hypothetical protein FF38_05228 [Lucilia cuprina]